MGEYVEADEVIARIETDKVTVDILSQHSGVITKVFAEEGDTVEVGAEFVEIDTDAKAPEGGAAPKEAPTQVSVYFQNRQILIIILCSRLPQKKLNQLHLQRHQKKIHQHHQSQPQLLHSKLHHLNRGLVFKALPLRRLHLRSLELDLRLASR